MGKIKSLYKDGIDRVWYDSSNIIYSECDDVLNSLKTVKLVFKDGRTYIYYDVDVNDYLLFRESPSQGKAFIKFIKQYKFNKIDNFDVLKLKTELEVLLNEDLSLEKDKLFKELENISYSISQLTASFKKTNLSDNELSYISFFINKIIKDLVLINFTDREINLLDITDKVNAIIDELKSEKKELLQDNDIILELKNKLL